MTAKEVCIIGGGPVGCALAVGLVRLGYSVVLYERYRDIRMHSPPSGRSINLVLTRRGIKLASLFGLEEALLRETVQVSGRCIHNLDGTEVYQAYGRSGECNYSIDRSVLNQFWLTAAENAGCRIVFDHTLRSFDAASGMLSFHVTESGVIEKVDISQFAAIFGADGAGSLVRQGLQQAGFVKVSEELISTCYKEVVFPSVDSANEYCMNPNSLHIWPRQEHMLMALANTNGSFTGTLFMDGASACANGEHPSPSFDSVCESVDTAEQFLTRYYSNALTKMNIPEALSNLVNFKQGILGTVRTHPWTVDSLHGTSVCLIGDAAHAIVPFFGQGVNCGLEDVVVLMDIIKRIQIHSGCSTNSLHLAMKEFSTLRKKDSDAIAELALENLEEMRSKVADPKFRFLKSLDNWIMQNCPDMYITRYALVMYSCYPYSVCRDMGQAQMEFLEMVVNKFQLDSAADANSVFNRSIDLVELRCMLQEHVVPKAKQLGMCV